MKTEEFKHLSTKIGKLSGNRTTQVFATMLNSILYSIYTDDLTEKSNLIDINERLKFLEKNVSELDDSEKAPVKSIILDLKRESSDGGFAGRAGKAMGNSLKRGMSSSVGAALAPFPMLQKTVSGLAKVIGESATGTSDALSKKRAYTKSYREFTRKMGVAQRHQRPSHTPNTNDSNSGESPSGTSGTSGDSGEIVESIRDMNRSVTSGLRRIENNLFDLSSNLRTSKQPDPKLVPENKEPVVRDESPNDGVSKTFTIKPERVDQDAGNEPDTTVRKDTAASLSAVLSVGESDSHANEIKRLGLSRVDNDAGMGDAKGMAGKFGNLMSLASGTLAKSISGMFKNKSLLKNVTSSIGSSLKGLIRSAGGGLLKGLGKALTSRVAVIGGGLLASGVAAYKLMDMLGGDDAENRPKAGIVPKGEISSDKRARIAAITEEAKRQGVDPRAALSMVQAESGIDPTAKSKSSSASGLFGMIDETFSSMGGVNKDDEAEQIRTGISLMKEAKTVIGENPSVADMHALHILGQGDFKKHVTRTASSRDIPVTEYLSDGVIKANQWEGETQHSLQTKFSQRAERSLAEVDRLTMSAPASIGQVIPEAVPAKELQHSNLPMNDQWGASATPWNNSPSAPPIMLNKSSPSSQNIKNDNSVTTIINNTPQDNTIRALDIVSAALITNR